MDMRPSPIQVPLSETVQGTYFHHQGAKAQRKTMFYLGVFVPSWSIIPKVFSGTQQAGAFVVFAARISGTLKNSLLEFKTTRQEEVSAQHPQIHSMNQSIFLLGAA